MKTQVVLTALTAAALFAGSANAALVFADDFSEADGTLIDGKAADVGGPWSETGGAQITGGIMDTTGGARTGFADFTNALGAGEVLTLTVDAAEASGNFFNGFAGVSLFIGGSERIFVGHPFNSGSWGVDGGAIGGPNTTGNTTEDNTAVFTYVYDTGAWTFSLSSGENLSGTAAANEAYDRLRFANGDNGDLAIDALSVDISNVPEPGSLALLGLGGLMIARRRRA
ncbi:PEP-CTERM sorting domain-containing protein [Phycisphaeraceae bacterium D3-23]